MKITEKALTIIGALAVTTAMALTPVSAAGPKNCPPGLAKKNNGCLPPGQAKKRYTVGLPVPAGVPIVLVPTGTLRPPPGGHIYARVDGDLLLIAEATRKVVEAIIAVDAATRAVDD